MAESLDKNIVSFVCRMEGYKTALKAVHWNAGSLSEHKLSDEFMSSLNDFQDTVSELEQIIHKRIGEKDFEPVQDKVENNFENLLADIEADCLDMLKYVESLGPKYVGMKSEIESFVSTVQRTAYQASFCH